MNRDTPGAVPPDDFPFLGPAVSPRRRDAGASAPRSGELTGPFVGGMFQPVPPGRSAAPVEGEVEPPFGRAVAPAEEAAESLDDLPAADWPADDFPWLTPDEPAAEDDASAEDEPWRATSEVEELIAGPPQHTAEQEAAAHHFSWIGEPLQEVSDQPREPERGSEGEDESWSTAPSGEASGVGDQGATPEIGSFAWADEGDVGEVRGAEADAGRDERVGFSVDSDPAEDSWTEATEWGAIAPPAGDEDSEATATEHDSAADAPGFGWHDAADEAPSEGDRWAGAEGFQVEDELGAGRVQGGWAPEENAEPPVDVAPLPVGQWEESPAEAEVEEEPAQVPGSAGDAALLEVAERLERIARSLRSGKPVEAVEEGDPLQLLITGYALGYSQARRGRGD